MMVKLDKKDMYFQVDGSDLEKVNRYKWRLQNNNGRKYVDLVGRKHMYLHRYLLNPPIDMIVDHINGDTLDNRRCNLRICTIAENSRNRKIGKNNTTGYKGLERIVRKKGIAWRAVIEIQGKRKYIGTFYNKLDAAEAVDSAYIANFKGFFLLNVPNRGYP